jgi:uncharacterized membrane protein
MSKARLKAEHLFMRFEIGLAACVILCMLNACRHDVDLSGAPAVSFQSDVQSIIVSNCSESGCHSASGGKFPLISYADVRDNVTPGDARASKLYKSITGKGEKLMPPSPQPMLTNDEIRLIYLWIEQGANNN